MDDSPVFSCILSGVLLLLAAWLWWFVSRTAIRADASGISLETATSGQTFTWQEAGASWREMPEEGRTRQLLPYLISAAPVAMRGWCDFCWGLVYERERDELTRFVQDKVEQHRLYPAPADPSSWAPLEFRHPSWLKVLYLGFFGGFGVLLLAWPLYLHPVGPMSPGRWITMYAVLGGIGLLFLSIGIWAWWETHTYCLRVDDIGITERKGRNTITVRWTDVDSYSMEPAPGRRNQPRPLAPILKDTQGRELLRVQPPTGSLRQKNLLRKFIESKVH